MQLYSSGMQALTSACNPQLLKGLARQGCHGLPKTLKGKTASERNGRAKTIVNALDNGRTSISNQRQLRHQAVPLIWCQSRHHEENIKEEKVALDPEHRSLLGPFQSPGHVDVADLSGAPGRLFSFIGDSFGHRLFFSVAADQTSNKIFSSVCA